MYVHGFELCCENEEMEQMKQIMKMLLKNSVCKMIWRSEDEKKK